MTEPIDLSAHRRAKESSDIDKIGALIASAARLARDRPLLAYLLDMAALATRREREKQGPAV